MVLCLLRLTACSPCFLVLPNPRHCLSLRWHQIWSSHSTWYSLSGLLFLISTCYQRGHFQLKLRVALWAQHLCHGLPVFCLFFLQSSYHLLNWFHLIQCSPGCPRAYCVDQAGLEFKACLSLLSAGIKKTCAATPSLNWFLGFKCLESRHIVFFYYCKLID